MINAAEIAALFVLLTLAAILLCIPSSVGRNMKRKIALNFQIPSLLPRPGLLLPHDHLSAGQPISGASVRVEGKLSTFGAHTGA